MLKITLRQMEVFQAVATTGSTTAAAAVVGLSQSAVSAALHELEQGLGLVLFDRLGRRLHMSSQGRELLPRIAVLLDGARAIEGWGDDGWAGTASLRIGASTTIGNYLLPQLLAQFRLSLPLERQAQWSAQVSIANTQEIARQVADFELDVGLIEGPCPRAELQTMPWLSDELVIVAAADLPWVKALQAKPENSLSQQQLSEQLWLLREPGSGTRAAIVQALAPYVNPLREGVQFANSEAIKRAVAQGLGISCLSRWVVADALAAGQLVELKTELPRLSRMFSRVLHRDKSPSSALQKFCTFLDQHAQA